MDDCETAVLGIGALERSLLAARQKKWESHVRRVWREQLSFAQERILHVNLY